MPRKKKGGGVSVSGMDRTRHGDYGEKELDEEARKYFFESNDDFQNVCRQLRALKRSLIVVSFVFSSDCSNSNEAAKVLETGQSISSTPTTPGLLYPLDPSHLTEFCQQSWQLFHRTT